MCQSEKFTLLFKLLLIVNIILVCEPYPLANINKSLKENLNREKRSTKINYKQLGPIYVDDSFYDNIPTTTTPTILNIYNGINNISDTSMSSLITNLDKDNEIDELNLSNINIFLTNISRSDILSNTDSTTLPTVKTYDFLLPNKELIDIFEKHIEELNPHLFKRENLKSIDNNQKNSSTEIKTSYMVPLSSIIGNISNSNNTIKDGPPGTSYGIPDLKATPYPPYNLQFSKSIPNSFLVDKREINIPPPSTYGIPITKINIDDTKFQQKIVKKEIKTSYGVPLNSVLNLSTDKIENLNPPDLRITLKFNSDEETDSNKETNINTTEDSTTINTQNLTKEKKNCILIQESISSSYTLDEKTGELKLE